MPSNNNIDYLSVNDIMPTLNLWIEKNNPEIIKIAQTQTPHKFNSLVSSKILYTTEYSVYYKQKEE